MRTSSAGDHQPERDDHRLALAVHGRQRDVRVKSAPKPHAVALAARREGGERTGGSSANGA
jgi:hypothetical protein